jgi:glyoxalase family protein
LSILAIKRKAGRPCSRKLRLCKTRRFVRGEFRPRKDAEMPQTPGPAGAPGLHHVTAVSTDMARTRAFYVDLLGLRLVKRTVAHEDPGAHHLFFGGRLGAPGTLLTMFCWPGAGPCQRGAGEVERVVFAVPSEALAWWQRRLAAAGAAPEPGLLGFGVQGLRFEDPDGAPLALAGTAMADALDWTGAGLAPEARLRGLSGVALAVRDAQAMGTLLTHALGFAETAREDGRIRYAAHGGAGGRVDLHPCGDRLRGRTGAGTIHHAAFRARDLAELGEIADRLRLRFGIEAGQAKDRAYYRSIHFRGPDGMLIEVATDGPGLLRDETPEALGAALRLPSLLEPRRAEIERVLPPLDAP